MATAHVCTPHRVPGGHVDDLMAQDAGKLALGIRQGQQPARDVDVPIGKGKGVRLRENSQAIYMLSDPLTGLSALTVEVIMIKAAIASSVAESGRETKIEKSPRDISND